MYKPMITGVEERAVLICKQGVYIYQQSNVYLMCPINKLLLLPQVTKTDKDKTKVD
jgi:hypothetical protein